MRIMDVLETHNARLILRTTERKGGGGRRPHHDGKEKKKKREKCTESCVNEHCKKKKRKAKENERATSITCASTNKRKYETNKENDIKLKGDYILKRETTTQSVRVCVLLKARSMVNLIVVVVFFFLCAYVFPLVASESKVRRWTEREREATKPVAAAATAPL